MLMYFCKIHKTTMFPHTSRATTLQLKNTVFLQPNNSLV